MNSLTVWARVGLPPRSLGNAVLWEAFLPDDAPPDWVSLPEYVHHERESLRTRYQSWLADVSQRKLKGVTVAEFMSIRSNLSYWWMTLPTDNSLAADSPAYRVLRLFALTSIAEGKKFDHVRVVTDRRAVAEAVALWADSIGKPCTVDFSDPSTGQPNRHQRPRGPFLAALRVFWNHLLISIQPSRKAGRAAAKNGIVFIDYLAHLQKPGLDGAFRSNYWGPLVELLEDWPEPINWLHIPAAYATPAVIRSDVDKCEAFNTLHPAHCLLHSYLDLETVGRALRDYVRIRRFGRNLRRQLNVFVERETGLDPSPLLHDLVTDQYFGRTAALNAFWINLWESTIHALPRQRLGVYLFENQPWELAFLSAWHRSHFGQALAVAHSTMRFWDLRYFSGDTFSNLCDKPAPNFVVVNGPLMKTAALDGGFPESLLTIAEALRFQTEEHARGELEADLLVLGEYEVGQDEELSAIMREIIKGFKQHRTVSYRPHPTAKHHQQMMPETWLLSEHTSVNAALTSCRIVVCGPTTSAALDARLNGRSVIVIGKANKLVSSPAIGLPNVHLLKSKLQFTELERTIFTEQVTGLDPEPLCKDPQLTQWQHLLSYRRPNDSSI